MSSPLQSGFDEDFDPPRLALVPAGSSPDSTWVPDEAPESVTLYRVVGPHERGLLEAEQWQRIPRRADWSVTILKLVDEATAFDTIHRSRARRRVSDLSVVEVPVRRAYAESVRVEIPDRLTGRTEYWIEASQLDDLNAQLMGPIAPVRP